MGSPHGISGNRPARFDASRFEAVLDLDVQADRAEERRQVELDYQREQAVWLARNALPIVTDATLDAAYRLGYAAPPVLAGDCRLMQIDPSPEAIGRHRPVDVGIVASQSTPSRNVVCPANSFRY